MPTELRTPELPGIAKDSTTRLQELLDRPASDRLREHKYRFAQSVVFGIPVVALQWWGRQLGPADSDRWVSLIQSLLCGWIVYVNIGMLVEGVLVPRLRLRGDFLVALVATVLYVYSAISALHGIITLRLWYPSGFHVVVILLALWSGMRWRQLAKKLKP